MSPGSQLSNAQSSGIHTAGQPRDVLVVGGGVVGLACARALSLAGHAVVLVERHGLLGSETSSRNSEVVHAGIYYPTESLKTRLCVEGRARLLAFCAAERVPHRLCGKLIVATEDDERPALDGIEARAAAAGPEVPLQRWTAAQVRARAPAVRAVEALWSAGTGIVDGHAFMHRLRVRAEALGALVLLRHTVVGVRPGAGGEGYHVTLQAADAGHETHRFDAVVNAAGHGANAVAALVGLDAGRVPQQIPVKGSYFTLAGAAPADTLVYPVPRPNLVGLGTHLTLDLGGRARLGPDVELDAPPFDHTVDPARRARFAQAARRFLPALREDDLQPDYSGFRPKLATDRFADFYLAEHRAEGLPGWVNLLGIESPGLTASLAIAARVCQLLDA